MNNFIVSARKYRPSTFGTVVGQDYIVTTLKNAIKNNQLAQAFLFTGPRGVGKTTCARILAKTINCTNLTEDFEACNECESCRSFNELASFNVHELDAASNNSVDDIRTLVDQVRIPPQAGLYKVYIIDEVHMLSAAAFNAFLKTLEEPPSYAKFILATTEKHKIIPTILSRCQVFDFKRIKIDDISKHLAYVAKSENVQFEPQALHIIATKSDGALRDALSIFDQMVSYGSSNITMKAVIENLNILDYEYYFRLVSSVLEADTTALLLTLDEIYEKGFDGQAIMTGLSEHIRSLLVCKDPQTLPLLEVHEDLSNDYLNQSKMCSVKFLISALDVITSADISYKAAGNKRFHIELAVLKLAGKDNESAGDIHPKNDQSPIANIKKPESPPVQTLPQAPTAPTTQTAPEQSIPQDKVAEDKQSAYPSETSSAQKPQENTYEIEDFSVTEVIKRKSGEKPTNGKVDIPFQDADVLRAYEQFCDQIRKDEEKGYVSSLLPTTRFEKVDELTWNLIIASKAETEAFKNLEMQTWFRETLSNRTFTLHFQIENRTNQQQVMSREEKIRDFIHHNPEVQRILNELDAEPEI
jgi:DNA polymerase III subunit gamma/tau